MSITSLNDIVVALAAKQSVNIYKNITAGKTIGAFQSSWLATGYPGAGPTPPAYTAGSGYTCDKSTVGAFPYSNAAVKNWIAKLFAASAIAGVLYLYDRLWSCSGMGFAAGTYAITTPGSLPARITDNGLGCELWVEQNNAAAGAATGTLVANYVAPGGGGEVGTIPAVVSAPLIGQMQQVPLAAGNTGVKQLTSVVTNQTWTSGTFGMTICKQICAIEIPAAGLGKTLDWAGLGLQSLYDDMCLFAIWQGAATTLTSVIARMGIIDK